MPTAFLQIVAFNLLLLHWTMGLSEVSASKNHEQLKEAGKSALWMSILMIICDVILTIGILDQESYKIFQSVASMCVSGFFSLAVYYCFYVPEYYQRKYGQSASEQAVPAILKRHGAGALMILGVCTLLMALAGFGHAIYENYFDVSKEARAEAYTETERRIASEADSYATSNCKVMPQEELSKRYDDIEKEEYSKRGLQK